MPENRNLGASLGSSDPPSSGDKSARQAYCLVSARIAQVPEQGLPHLTLDIPGIVTVVLRAVKQYRTLRPEIVKCLPLLDLRDIDQLHHYARALFHLHTSWMF